MGLRIVSVISAASMVVAFLSHALGYLFRDTCCDYPEELYAELQRPSLALSPNGKQAIIATNEGRLYLVDLAAGIKKPFQPQVPKESSPNGVGLIYPAFSPDSKTVVFSADSNLWIAPVEGQTLHAKRITTKDKGYTDMMPSFSPDGSQLAFVRAFNDDHVEGSVTHKIYTCRPDGSDLQCRTRDSYESVNRVSFSPDGRTILFSAAPITDKSSNFLYTIPAKSPLNSPDAETFIGPRYAAQAPEMQKRPRYGTKENEYPAPIQLCFFNLSRDGKQLVFLSDNEEEPCQFNLRTVRVSPRFTFPVERVQTLQHIPRSKEVLFPTFSPDGRSLYYLDSNDPHLILMKMDSTGKYSHKVCDLPTSSTQ